MLASSIAMHETLVRDRGHSCDKKMYGWPKILYRAGGM